jgi:hypothetical protein
MTKKRWVVAGLAAAVAVVAIVGLILWLGDDTQDAFVAGYRTTDDPTSIIVVVTIGPGDEIVQSSAAEKNDRVLVTVKVRGRSGQGNSSAVDREVTIRLKQALGDRKVVSSDGRVLSPVPSPRTR